MRADRLLKLADFLETVPPAAFDINKWEARPATKPEGEIPGECGFAGCALGWAGHAKLFEELRFDDGEPECGGESGYAAADKLFEFERGFYDRSVSDSEHLFDPTAYDTPPSPTEVADRIREFVKDNAVSP